MPDTRCSILYMMCTVVVLIVVKPRGNMLIRYRYFLLFRPILIHERYQVQEEYTSYSSSLLPFHIIFPPSACAFGVSARPRAGPSGKVPPRRTCLPRSTHARTLHARQSARNAALPPRAQGELLPRTSHRFKRINNVYICDIYYADFCTQFHC